MLRDPALYLIFQLLEIPGVVAFRMIWIQLIAHLNDIVPQPVVLILKHFSCGLER